MVPTGRTAYDANGTYGRVVRATNVVTFPDDTHGSAMGYKYATGPTRTIFNAAMTRMATAMNNRDRLGAADALTSVLPLLRDNPEASEAVKAMRNELGR